MKLYYPDSRVTVRQFFSLLSEEEVSASSVSAFIPCLNSMHVSFFNVLFWCSVRVSSFNYLLGQLYVIFVSSALCCFSTVLYLCWQVKYSFIHIHTGLVFNGVAVLGLAAEGVDQVTIQGDVEIHVQPLLSHRSVCSSP